MVVFPQHMDVYALAHRFSPLAAYQLLPVFAAVESSEASVPRETQV